VATSTFCTKTTHVNIKLVCFYINKKITFTLPSITLANGKKETSIFKTKYFLNVTLQKN